MKQNCDDLKQDFKRILNRFRLDLLLSDLLKGSVILLAFFSVYLLLYYAVIHFFFLQVYFKSILYFLFLTGIGVLFILFLLYPFLFYFRALNLKKMFLLKRILPYFPGREDMFTSLYHLAFLPETMAGDEQLKAAAFAQKYGKWAEDKISLSFPYKRLLQKAIMLIVLLLILFPNSSFFNRLFSDLSAYGEVRDPRRNIDFVILNSSLDAEYGRPFQLRLAVNSDFLSVENVFVCYGGGEFLMNPKDSVFVYDFDVVNNDIQFTFKTHDIESKLFKIRVLPTPEITDYKITNIPPAYTGLKAETIRNTVDFKVVYGSVLQFGIDFSNVDTLFLQTGDELSAVSLNSVSPVKFSKTVKASGEYILLGSNENFIRKSLIHFNVTCIPDLYPGIQVSEMQDSLNHSLYYFYGIISDDYGFSDLRFNYSLNGQANTVMPIHVAGNVNTQEFYFEFNFAEFAGMDKTQVRYFFEVFDNDAVSGPKSTRSGDKLYQVPNLNTIFEYNAEANATMNTSLTEAEKLAKEIVTGVKELQKKMLDNTVDNWEKQQLSKDIVEKKEKLDKLLKQVQEENRKKTSLNANFTKQDSVLRAKQEKVEKLLDQVMNEEMKKLMEEFNKLAEEFNRDKFRNLEEKMKLGFDQLSEELDRNIELLKRYQIEEQHDMLSQQIQQLKKKQEDFQKLSEDSSVPSDSLSKSGEEVKKKLEDIANNYKKLLEDNQQLEQPFDLKNQDSSLEKLSQDVDKQKENAAEGKRDKDLSEKIKEQIDQLSEEMEQQQQENFMKMSLPQKDIELIIQNILLISFSQEDLLNQFREVPAQSVRYNELGRMQETKRQEYKIVKDSLSALAKSNLMLASVLNDKFYEIEIKFSLLPDYIQNNKRNELFKEQQFIIAYLNDMALTLSDALQQDKSEEGQSGSEGKSGNSGGKKQKGGKGNKEEGYGDLKNFQKGLKKQLEDLLSQMKKGEKGKPLQQGISKMIRENELFRQSLNEFMNENGSLSDTEKKLLNEIHKLLEDNIRDIANYSVTNNLIQRNNLIFNKLLISEKASKEREEYEEKRKSVTASETKYNRPEVHFKSAKTQSLIKTDLQKSGVKLNPYFKNLYNNYYIKLGDE